MRPDRIITDIASFETFVLSTFPKPFRSKSNFIDPNVIRPMSTILIKHNERQSEVHFPRRKRYFFNALTLDQQERRKPLKNANMCIVVKKPRERFFGRELNVR